MLAHIRRLDKSVQGMPHIAHYALTVFPMDSLRASYVAKPAFFGFLTE